MLSITYNCPWITYSGYSGYDVSIYPTNTVTVTSLTSAGIQAAINSLGTSGGQVILPNGTYDITNTVVLDDNVHLVGQSRLGVILQANATIENVIYIKHGSNVGASNLSVDCNNLAERGIFFWYADEVMVFDTTVYDSTKNGVQYRYVSSGTYYNNETYGHSGHGFVSDDCQAGVTSQAGCWAEFTSDYQGIFNNTNFTYSGGNGDLWTNNILIISNNCRNNGDYGIDYHGRNSQISCNSMSNNSTGGMKTQDAQGMWVDHNIWAGGNGSLNYRITQEYTGDLPGALGDNIIWANDYSLESGTWRYNDTINTHLVCNIYSSASDIILVTSGNVRIPNTGTTSGFNDDEVTQNTSNSGSFTVDNTYQFLCNVGLSNMVDIGHQEIIADVDSHAISVSDNADVVGIPVDYLPSGTFPTNATFTATGLPNGLIINSTTGRVTGTPTVAGVFNFTICCVVP